MGPDVLLSALAPGSDRRTNQTEEQKISGGHEVIHFVIDAGELNSGKYRARVKLGDDWVAEHEFLIEKTS